MKQVHSRSWHPGWFWSGCALVLAGVLAHLPMLWMGRHSGWQLAGMPMTPGMWVGMALIPLGLLLAGAGLLPRATGSPQPGSTPGSGVGRFFHVADGVPLNRAHGTLVTVLVVALAVDVMKPATLGFVLPGLGREYAIGPSRAGWLPLLALAGTTVGSLAWGRMADRVGRRAAILMSALMFMGTAICGAMPTFGWNLAMCFLMGLSAGGLLPIAFTLLAETVPARHRGWLLVLLGGLGTAGGYWLAAGAAAWLEPHFGWRVLWLLGLPTGALIVLLHRWIPESPRFLAHHGMSRDARRILERFAGDALERDDAAHPPPPAIDAPPPVSDMRALLHGRQAATMQGLLLGGLAWGLVSFGFVLWLPVNLVALGVQADATSALLARSALLALPGMVPVIWLYHRWSTIRTLVMFLVLTALALLAFAAMAWRGWHPAAATTLATALLLVSSSGVVAMLIPYATEIHPVQSRGTGAGTVAAATKFGGLLGAALGVVGLFQHLALSALLLALPLAAAAVVLARHGPDTQGRRLEDIQQGLERHQPRA